MLNETKSSREKLEAPFSLALHLIFMISKGVLGADMFNFDSYVNLNIHLCIRSPFISDCFNKEKDETYDLPEVHFQSGSI